MTNAKRTKKANWIDEEEQEIERPPAIKTYLIVFGEDSIQDAINKGSFIKAHYLEPCLPEENHATFMDWEEKVVAIVKNWKVIYQMDMPEEMRKPDSVYNPPVPTHFKTTNY